MFLTLVAEVRAYLGTPRRLEAQLHHVHKALHRIEHRQEETELIMSDFASQINANTDKLDAIAADVKVLVDGDTSGLDPELQAAIDRLSGRVDSLQGEVGDRDGSDVPVDGDNA